MRLGEAPFKGSAFIFSMAEVPVALTVSDSDSSGGSGIQADLKTFSSLGVYGASAITAVAAQDTRRVHGSIQIEPALVSAQIGAVIDDLGAETVKTGTLPDAPTIAAVASRLRDHNIRNLVVDPVMLATNGEKLLADEAVEALKVQLLPLALVLTPNVSEAEVLAGVQIQTWDDLRQAAEIIHSLGAANVVIKGTRLGEYLDDPMVTDLLYDGQDFREFTANRVETDNTRGTGCTFSSAIAATLAKGDNVATSVAAAKAFVTKALQDSFPLGQGRGPVHHFYRYWRPAIDRPTDLS